MFRKSIVRNSLFCTLLIAVVIGIDTSYAMYKDYIPPATPASKQEEPEQSLPTSSEFFTNLNNMALMGSSSTQISTEPNESINLFTGTVHRQYKEISIPVAPGLNMEFIRSYSSSAYPEREYLSYAKYDNLDLAHPNWRFDSGYITTQIYCDNKGYDECNPVYVAADGNSQKLIPENTDSNNYKTKNYWRGSRDNNLDYILLDNSGRKYYFNNRVLLRETHKSRAVRSYLTKIETPDGAWVKYDYNQSYLVKITSSNGNNSINIDYTTVQGKHDTLHYYVQRPHKVYLNKKLVVTYGYYPFLKNKDSLHIYPVISAHYSNGRSITYSYNWLGNYLTLTGLTYSNNDTSSYQYVIETGLAFGPMKLVKKTAKKHGAYNSTIYDWTFDYKNGVSEDFVKTLTTEVKGPHTTFSTTFSDYQDGYAWRAGLPLNHTVYTDKNSNIAQQVIFSWDKYYFAGQAKFGGALLSAQNGKDDATYLARLVNKQVQRDGLFYNTDYLDYDLSNNPKKIIDTGDDGNIRITLLNYFYNLENNIVGYLQSQKIDNREILSRGFDAKGHMLSESNYGIMTRYQYDNKGNLAKKIDANNNITTYADYKGIEPQKIIRADNTVVYNTVDKVGNIISHKDSLGHLVKYQYDVYNQKTYEKPAQGHEYNINYNNYTKEERQGDKLIKTNYNLSGQIEKVISKDLQTNQSKVKKYRYDGEGRKVFESFLYKEGDYTGDIYGHYYVYDALSRLVKDCYPTPEEYCDVYQYNLNGKNSLKVVKANGEHVTKYYQSYSPDSEQNLVKIEDAFRDTVINRDTWGRITAIKQGNLTRSYQYDSHNNVTKIKAPDTGLIEYQYDQIGNTTKKIINKNKYISYSYNKSYNLREKSYSDGSSPTIFSYDSEGNMLSANKGHIGWKYGYDKNNNLISENLTLKAVDDTEQSFNLKYDYDGYNHLKNITYPDGSIINYAPNSFGEPSKVSGFVDGIKYYSSGHWQSMKYANGLKLNANIDKLKRPITTSIGDISYNYEYDSNNNLLQIQTSDNYHKQLRFTYDLNGRIYIATGPWGVKRYSYDINDNITSITNLERSFKNDDKYFIYDKNNHLTGINAESITRSSTRGALEYDSLGFLSSDYDNDYSYDLDGNLWKISGSQKEYYNYDAFNHRILKRTKNGETITVFNKSGQEMYEYNTLNQQAKKFIYLNGKKILQASAKANNTKKEDTYYFFNDHVGSPLMIFDSKGNLKSRDLYLPFGQRFSLKNSSNNEQVNKHWFAGKEQDNNGLSYFGARYYNAELGRFLTPDPVDVFADNPISFNRYIYANNNPYKYVDPDGKWAVQILATAVGAGTGFISAWISGERDYVNLGKSAAIGAGIGFISSFGGGTAMSAAAVGATGNSLGDSAYKAWTGNSDQITPASLVWSAGLGATGGLVGNWLGFRAVPNRNLPAARGTYTNYIQQTIRQLAHNDSEVVDSVRRSIHSTIQGGAFGITLSAADSYSSSLSRDFNSNDGLSELLAINFISHPYSNKYQG